MEKVSVEKTASSGIAIAAVLKYREPDLSADQQNITEDEVAGEQRKFADAKAAVIRELEALAASSEIFAAHLEIAEDFTLQESVDTKIRSGKKNAQAALSDAVEEFATHFDGMDDAYMKERAADIRDIGKRIMAKLKSVELPDLGNLQAEAIVAARDLYPSDTVKIKPELVKGIITEEGGVTSHVSILAKSRNIPILTGAKGIMDKLSDGSMVCMDAQEGTIVIDPDRETLAAYQTKKEACERERLRLEKLRSQPAVTPDGKRISLCANVGNAEDIRSALEMNIDGVGLFRSEFLYMEHADFPTEQEQFEVYRKAVQLCPQEMTIRTLDIGGDKELPYFAFEKEKNPSLGWRGIRVSLDRMELFKAQLRAILRASAYGNVRILFPMIISLEEFRQAKATVTACKQELAAEGQAFDDAIMLGMMMETPASVLLAEEFAKEADFFSIGTNDLIQYLLAVDRENKKVADRCDYFHPAVIKAIGQIIAAGHREGIKVGMCGEMAGDRDAVALLLKLGLDEFSMSPGSIDGVREQILNREA